jgi:hypothetical protein
LDELRANFIQQSRIFKRIIDSNYPDQDAIVPSDPKPVGRPKKTQN